MNHYPYEELIVSDDTLSPAEAAQLKEHLAVCNECRTLSYRWQAARLQISREGMASPAPGFTMRWQQQMPGRINRMETQAARRFLFIILGVSAAMLIGWTVTWLLNTSSANIAASLIKLTANGILLFQGVKFMVVPALRSVPLVYFLAGFSLLSTTVLALTAVWAGAVWHYVFRKTHGMVFIKEGVKNK